MKYYDIVFSAGILALVVLFIVFLFFWLRSDEQSSRKFIWLIVALVLPIVGPLVYLTVRYSKKSQ